MTEGRTSFERSFTAHGKWSQPSQAYRARSVARNRRDQFTRRESSTRAQQRPFPTVNPTTGLMRPLADTPNAAEINRITAHRRCKHLPRSASCSFAPEHSRQLRSSVGVWPPCGVADTSPGRMRPTLIRHKPTVTQAAVARCLRRSRRRSTVSSGGAYPQLVAWPRREPSRTTPSVRVTGPSVGTLSPSRSGRPFIEATRWSTHGFRSTSRRPRRDGPSLRLLEELVVVATVRVAVPVGRRFIEASVAADSARAARRTSPSLSGRPFIEVGHTGPRSSRSGRRRPCGMALH